MSSPHQLLAEYQALSSPTQQRLIRVIVNTILGRAVRNYFEQGYANADTMARIDAVEAARDQFIHGDQAEAVLHYCLPAAEQLQLHSLAELCGQWLFESLLYTNPEYRPRSDMLEIDPGNIDPTPVEKRPLVRLKFQLQELQRKQDQLQHSGLDQTIIDQASQYAQRLMTEHRLEHPQDYPAVEAQAQLRKLTRRTEPFH
ncbi:MAG: hypothetical protein HYV33_01085 [Candidatus Kerfeldbacteria bacterium]|nr:hypothetical protein [Candidatus Kerfeldbacteria bacterium]